MMDEDPAPFEDKPKRRNTPRLGLDETRKLIAMPDPSNPIECLAVLLRILDSLDDYSEADRLIRAICAYHAVPLEREELDHERAR
jgi:hypothetical protein